MYRNIVITLMLLNPLFFFSQEIKDSLQPSNYKNAVFVEVLGATGYLSLNYQRSFNVYKNIVIIPSIGVGIADGIITPTSPQLISYTTRLDLLYSKNKIIQPIIGYAFSHNFEVGNPNSFRVGCVDGCSEKYTYLINAFSLGVSINLSKRIEITPKYYALYVKRSDFSDIIFINWSGLQLKYKF